MSDQEFRDEKGRFLKGRELPKEYDQKMAAAMAGNSNGLKIKDKELRQKAFQKLCDWLAKGKSRDSFTFQEGDLKCTYKTLKSYIDQNPGEFPILHQEYAIAQGYAEWEQVVEDSAKGLNKDANTASLQMKMRNMFKWDRDLSQKDELDTSKLEALSKFFSSLASHGKEPEKNKTHSE
jgi:hypothetical protein